jgi:hypothetical protein
MNTNPHEYLDMLQPIPDVDVGSTRAHSGLTRRSHRGRNTKLELKQKLRSWEAWLRLQPTCADFCDRIVALNDEHVPDRNATGGMKA